MDEILTSANNSVVKRLRKLMRSAKARRDENTYLAEGIHLASSFLAAGGAPTLYVCAESARHNKEIAELVGNLNDKKIPGVVVSDGIFESISTIHAPVGIILLFSPATPDKKDIASLRSSVVLLEDVQDPGNLGTILRTATATGIKLVALSPGCSSPWSPKALRAGMGAQFNLIIHEDVSLEEIIKTTKIPTLATTLAADSRNLYTLDLRNPVAWLFGNEGQGVSPSLAENATTRVIIPQTDTSVESLNVAAAVAVCLYEQYRQKTFSSA